MKELPPEELARFKEYMKAKHAADLAQTTPEEAASRKLVITERESELPRQVKDVVLELGGKRHKCAKCGQTCLCAKATQKLMEYNQNLILLCAKCGSETCALHGDLSMDIAVRMLSSIADIHPRIAHKACFGAMEHIIASEGKDGTPEALRLLVRGACRRSEDPEIRKVAKQCLDSLAKVPEGDTQTEFAMPAFLVPVIGRIFTGAKCLMAARKDPMALLKDQIDNSEPVTTDVMGFTVKRVEDPQGWSGNPLDVTKPSAN